MKPLVVGFAAFGLFVADSIWLRAQESASEAITLSPFMISSGSNYRAGRQEPNQPPPVAITLRKRAENVALQITLQNENRNAETRNREMFDTLTRLLEKAAGAAGIRVHNGAITLSTRNRGWLGSMSSSEEPSTRIDLFVLGALAENRSPLETTNDIKRFLASVEPVGLTKVVEGSVGLSIKEPERFRQELLGKIIDDVHFVRRQLGDRVKIAITGLDGRILVRQFSDSEVELYLNYGYAVNYEGG